MALPPEFYNQDSQSICKLKDCNEELYKEAFSRIDQSKEVFLITWNPRPSFGDHGTNGKYLTSDILKWEQMLEVLWDADLCCEPFAFVPEISLVGKLHMHGFFQVKDRRKLSQSWMRELRKGGFIKVNKARSLKWDTFKYHLKEIGDTQIMLPSDIPIIITDMVSEQMRNHIRNTWLLRVKKVNKSKTIDYYFNNDINSD